MSFNCLLIDTCTTRRYSEGVQDGYGHPVQTWADYLVDEPCRLTVASRESGREFKVGAELVVADYTLFVNDVDIIEQDRVVVNSITYEVIFVSTRKDGVAEHHKECWLKTIR